MDDNVLVMRGTDKFYYMKDGLASVRQLIDAGQVTQNAYDYYAFGEILSETEAGPQRGHAPKTRALVASYLPTRLNMMEE